MSTLTIRIPETKHARLRLLAQNRCLSMNKLMDELATVALTQHDAETRFRALAAKGSVKRGLELLDKLDRRDSAVRAGVDRRRKAIVCPTTAENTRR